MERRILGKTGVEVAVLGFGCGAVGGLMVRGTAADQERAVARALALGINYFDTAPVYGDGESEKNLGRVLKALRPSVVVGTKVRIPDEARGQIVKAFVMTPACVGASDALARELQEFVKAELAPYKYPRAIEFVSELPRTLTGKLQR